jgi:hypothetical protein
MDFSILYRVIWMPNAVFKQFVSKFRLEPFIMIGVIGVISVINAYLGRIDEVVRHPFLLFAGVIQACLFALLFPIVDATIIILIARFVFKKEEVNFISLVSILILCNLPYYIEVMLTVFLAYPSIGLGTLITLFGDINLFILGMFTVITPFFIWVVILWTAAMRQIFSLQYWQRILLVSTLILTSMLLGGLWSILKCYMARI